MNRTCTCLALLAAALLLACDLKPDARTGKAPARLTEPRKAGGGGGLMVDKYPIPRFERPYQDVHESVKKAINLVELAYWMVGEKHRSSDPARKAEASREVESSIFVVNETVEGLFKDAIKEQPDNPLNYAAYAVYLKPRKRTEGSGFVNCEAEAIEQLDKAIELWPDEAVFYLLKVFVYTEPHRCHDWYRGTAMEELGIAQQMDKIDEAYRKAEQYYPENAFINYSHALTKNYYSDPALFGEIREELLREVRTGNRKAESYFFFPPPLRPYAAEAPVPRLFGTETEPKYVDQWLFFGSWNYTAAHGLLEALVNSLSWPQDRDEIGDVMFFAYRLGATKPYDRSFFGWQQIMLDKWLSQEDLPTAERTKLAEAARYLTGVYRDESQKLLQKGLLKDETKLDLAGISEVESGASRQVNIAENLQAPQARYLAYFGEKFGLRFPLPEDKEDW